MRYAQPASGLVSTLTGLGGKRIPGRGTAARVMKTVSAADLSARRQAGAGLGMTEKINL